MPKSHPFLEKKLQVGLNFYDLPSNGPSAHLYSADLSYLGCGEVRTLDFYGVSQAILCGSASQVVIYNPAILQVEGVVDIGSCPSAGKITIQKR